MIICIDLKNNMNVALITVINFVLKHSSATEYSFYHGQKK